MASAQQRYEAELAYASRVPMEHSPTTYEKLKITSAARAPPPDSVKSSIKAPTIPTYVPTEEDEKSIASLRPIYRSNAAHMGERPLPEDDGCFTNPDSSLLEDSAPAFPGAGNRALQQETRFQLKREEERQTKEDRFWGLDNEAREQVRDGKLMAAADELSLAHRAKDKLEQQHSEWERAGRERRDNMWRVADQRNEEARRSYMRMFHEAETSDEVMDYRWPTVPSLEPYFGSIERKDWWPLDKPMDPDQRHTFHAVKGQRRHDVTQLHVDEFVKAVDAQRALSEQGPAGTSVMASTRSTTSTNPPLMSALPSTGDSQVRSSGKVSLAPLQTTSKVAAGGNDANAAVPAPFFVKDGHSTEKPYSGGLLRGTPIEMMSKADIRTYERLGWRVKQSDARRLGLVTKATSPQAQLKVVSPPTTAEPPAAFGDVSQVTVMPPDSLEYAGAGQARTNPTTIAPSRPESVTETINAIKQPFTEIKAATFVGRPIDTDEEKVWRAFFEAAAEGNASQVHGTDLSYLLRDERQRFSEASGTLRAIRDEPTVRETLEKLETENPAGFSIDEWVIFCDSIRDFTTWNKMIY